MEKPFETEVLQRLTKIETKLDFLNERRGMYGKSQKNSQVHYQHFSFY